MCAGCGIGGGYAWEWEDTVGIHSSPWHCVWGSFNAHSSLQGLISLPHVTGNETEVQGTLNLPPVRQAGCGSAGNAPGPASLAPRCHHFTCWAWLFCVALPHTSNSPGAPGRAPQDSTICAPTGAAPTLAQDNPRRHRPIWRLWSEPRAPLPPRTSLLAPARLPAEREAQPEEASRPTALQGAQGKAFAETLVSEQSRRLGWFLYSGGVGMCLFLGHCLLSAVAQRMLEAPGRSLTSWTAGIAPGCGLLRAPDSC